MSSAALPTPASYNTVSSYGMTGYAPLKLTPTAETPSFITSRLKEERGDERRGLRGRRELERRVAGHAVAADRVVRGRGGKSRRRSGAGRREHAHRDDAAEEGCADHEDQCGADQEGSIAPYDAHAGLRGKRLHLAVLALFSNLLSQVGALPGHPRMRRSASSRCVRVGSRMSRGHEQGRAAPS